MHGGAIMLFWRFDGNIPMDLKEFRVKNTSYAALTLQSQDKESEG
jgi:hypothetical protein